MSSDGENTMMGRHVGIVTRIVACTENEMLRIWCALHQMDIVFKATAEGIDNDIWVKFAYTYSVYLCAQDNLIINMNVKCPKKTNRWLHLGRMLNFFKSYHHPILEHTKAKRPDMMPTNQWWVITHAVALAIDSISVEFAELQAKSLLIAQQETIVQNLLRTIITIFGIEIVLLGNSNVQEGSLHVPAKAIVDHIENQGSFLPDCYRHLEADDQQDVVDHITKYTIALVTNLQSVKAERDGVNCAAEKDAPPLMPTQLVKLHHGTFLNEVFDPFRQHVDQAWSVD